jgi:cell division ATPase FtsA
MRVTIRIRNQNSVTYTTVFTLGGHGITEDAIAEDPSEQFVSTSHVKRRHSATRIHMRQSSPARPLRFPQIN